MKLGTTVNKLSGKILCPSIELSLTLTLLGGQSFRWKQMDRSEKTLGNRFQGVFKDRLWTLWQDVSHLHYIVHSRDKLDERQVEEILRQYFRLDENLEEHYREWSSRDSFFQKTCGKFVGIRMLNQDPRENLFSFLCSSNNNIARISGMIDKMCTEYGELICILDEVEETDHDEGDGKIPVEKNARKDVKEPPVTNGFEACRIIINGRDERSVEENDSGKNGLMKPLVDSLVSSNVLKGPRSVSKSGESSVGNGNRKTGSKKRLVKSFEDSKDSTLSKDPLNEITVTRRGKKYDLPNSRGTKRAHALESSCEDVKNFATNEAVNEATGENRISTRSTRGSIKLERKFDRPTDNSNETNGTETAKYRKVQTSNIAEDTKRRAFSKMAQKTRTKEKIKAVQSATSYFSFPSVESLTDPAVESRLRALGFGYRAKFIQQSAEYIMKAGGAQWLHKLQLMNYEESRMELMKLQGIGAKVADCICLMSLSHLQSVPVDTHVYQIAVNHYSFTRSSSKTLTPSVYNEIRGFFIHKFGPLAGWAHSILFCADLKKFQSKFPEENPKEKKQKVIE